MNIYEALNSVMKKVGAVAKDSHSTQGYNYRGVEALMNALQPALTEAKVFIVPEVLEQSREERQTSNGKLLLYSILKVKYKFYAEDGTCVEATTIGEGMDSSDKSSNKAMSNAFKYACFQVLCIPTEEMIDAEASDPLNEKAEEKKKQPKAESKASEFINPEELSQLLAECQRTGVKPSSAAETFGIECLEKMPKTLFKRAYKSMLGWKDKE